MQFLSYVCVWNVFANVYIQHFVDQVLFFKTNRIVVQDLFHSRILLSKVYVIQDSPIQEFCYLDRWCYYNKIHSKTNSSKHNQMWVLDLELPAFFVLLIIMIGKLCPKDLHDGWWRNYCYFGEILNMKV